ncbi:MAG TPA: heavy metal-associated domain-containing protein, partial [Streptosporangiaceae bacterium]|nr:heavy metal-associated domain-containing protein [Streptosporangiaceae bacterium]
MSTVAARRPAGPGAAEPRTAELAIGGMTCASCAARIERRLSRLGGVTATVNFATQTARVRFPAALAPAALIAAVEQAGYTATLPGVADGTAEEARAAAEMARLRRRLLVSLALAVPVVALAMVPAWQFGGWQWVSLV